MSSELPELIVEQGWDEAVPDTITMLEDLQKENVFDVEPVIAVLRAHKHVPGPFNGNTLVPQASDYPPLHDLENGISLSLAHLRNKILLGTVALGMELRKIVLLFGLYRYRAAAIERVPRTVEHGERETAADIVRYLAPVDGIFITLYNMRNRPDVRGVMFRIGMFAYEMYQNLCVNQEHSGQNLEDFFVGIRRRASHAHLALLYEALSFSLIAAPNRHQSMTHKELLRVAEISTPPRHGALAQSLYARELRDELKRTRTNLTDIQLHVLRPAERIWGALTGKCARCNKDATQCCTRCKRVVYCNLACQNAHWGTAHKGACQLFRDVNLKLKQEGYPLPWGL